MASRSRQQVLTTEEISRSFQDDWGGRFPPILNRDQACELLQIAPSTLYEWKSKGRLSGCYRKRGKHLFFWRDKLINTIFNGKEWT